MVVILLGRGWRFSEFFCIFAILMKARQVLIFFAGVFAMMGMLWLAVPADGVPVGPVTVRFASYQRTLQEAAEKKVDVDSVLTGVANRFRKRLSLL